MGTGLFLGVKRGRGVTLTTHPHLAQVKNKILPILKSLITEMSLSGGCQLSFDTK
jgi:hypothetical protein